MDVSLGLIVIEHITWSLLMRGENNHVNEEYCVHGLA